MCIQSLIRQESKGIEELHGKTVIHSTLYPRPRYHNGCLHSFTQEGQTVCMGQGMPRSLPTSATIDRQATHSEGAYLGTSTQALFGNNERCGWGFAWPR
ncbi:unnamed protein product [Prunus armeniaca]